MSDKPTWLRDLPPQDRRRMRRIYEGKLEELQDVDDQVAKVLDVLRETEDGFAIAERDWALRGGGDLLGLKQSGFPAYRFADPIRHRELLLAAADDARLVLGRDPDLTSPRGEAVKVLEALFDWRNDRPGVD